MRVNEKSVNDMRNIFSYARSSIEDAITNQTSSPQHKKYLEHLKEVTFKEEQSLIKKLSKKEVTL